MFRKIDMEEAEKIDMNGLQGLVITVIIFNWINVRNLFTGISKQF